jgi:hypothetical protein
MRIHKKRNHKKIILVFVILFLLLTGYTLTAYGFKFWPFTKNQFTEATEEQKTAGNNIKEKSLENTTEGSGDKKSSPQSKTPRGSDPSPAPTPSPNGGKSTVVVSITAATVDKSAATLYVRSLIQTISSNGTCTLSMRHSSGRTYSNSAGSQAGPSTSSCKGFNVPLSELTPGKWTITIHYEDATVTGSAEGEVVI